jgi:hypothetical protein
VTLAETNFASVSHSNPDWSSDGNSIYYDAPGAEDPQQNQNVWKLDLPTQQKCELRFDGAGDVNVSVSPLTNTTADGIPWNNVYFESQGGGFPLIIWRTNYLQPCLAPLPMGISFSPATLNFDGGAKTDLGCIMSFPPETQAAGYVCASTNILGRDGVRMRVGSLFPSPLMMGLAAKTDPLTGIPDFNENNSQETITCYWQRRRIQARLVALGLVNQNIPVEVDAYSNIVGRTFRGFGVLKIATSSLAGAAVRLEQNSPNPFNPVTKIRFAVSKASDVSLRVYNVRGELVKTIASGHFEQGMHEATWNGRNAAGQQVSSGVYYATAAAAGGSKDVIKMVITK